MIEGINEQFPDIQVVRVRSMKGPIVSEDAMSDEQINANLRLYLAHSPIYVEFDYYPDGDLEESMKLSQPLDSKYVAGIARQIAVTLSKIHQIPIQHRDLKPRNLLRKGNEYFLSDFGMAVKSEAARVGEGNRYGTRYYMAPEQFDRDANLTTKVDIWAFGVMVYRMLAGKFPFAGSKANEVEKKIKLGEFESLQTVIPSIQTALSELVAACMVQTPKDRLTAQEIVKRLSDWLEVEGITSDKPSWHAWHPTVISRLTQKRCVFILVELKTSNAEVHEEIAKLLRAYGCTVFRIYRILGEYDCLIRAYMTNESMELLESDVSNPRSDLGPIDRITVCSVKEILHHWYWAFDGFPIKKINEFDPDTAASLEPFLGKHSWEYSPDFQKQIKSGVIRKIHENNDKIIFFILVKQMFSRGDREQLLKQVQSVLNRFLSVRNKQSVAAASVTRDLSFLNQEKEKDICHLAVYALSREPYFMLIKAEVSDFFVIGELVMQLMKDLSTSGCMTMTCVASDRNVLGQEDLQLGNRVVGPITQMLVQEFPMLIDQWRELCTGGEPDEKQLRFAGEILLRVQYSVKRPFYKAVRQLLELMLMYKLRRKPIVQLFGRILLNVSIAAQESIARIDRQQNNLPTKQLLLLIAKRLAQRLKNTDSPQTRLLESMDFNELDVLSKCAQLDFPDNLLAEKGDSIERIILFLEKVYDLDEVIAAEFDGERPFTNYKSFESLGDDAK